MKDTRLCVGLVLDDTDHFVRPIVAMLRQHHTVGRFTPRFVRLPFIGTRVNDYLLERQLEHFLDVHDVVFFEWAGTLATKGSHLPGKAKRIVRAHRTELFSTIKELNGSSVDKLIFVSQAMRSRFIRHFPESSNRSLVIYNGVDLDRFRPSGRPFRWRIGMLGSLLPRKRVYDMICSLADLPAEVPWQLSVGGPPAKGDEDYWDALQALVGRLGLTERVYFAGHIADPTPWFNNVDVFLSASYSEGLQVSLLEAMASGCYCLSHCWDGVEEVLPVENIFTTDADLRAKLLAYAALPEAEKRQAQRRMRAIAEAKFDERRIVREIVNVVEQVARE